ncbi:MAG: CHASE domain-containing protein [Burkholderiales bacterium]|nr:CHASE domain-containing protein [Burkholderiales bacterium]
MLVVGLLVSLAAAGLVRNEIIDDEASRAGHAADQIALKIYERLEAHELILRSAAGLFAVAGNVDRNTWRTWIDTLNPEAIVPGVLGIGFSELVEPDQLEAHVARVRAEGFPQYAVTPPGEREIYSAIIYLEPFLDRNLRAFGYDMYSEPVRRRAMAEARDSGEAILSGKVQLVQETISDVQAGTLMYFPVYRAGMVTDTVKQRRDALIGWTYSPFRMGDLIAAALAAWKNQLGQEWQLALYDGENPAPEALLFGTSRAELVHSDSPLHHHRLITFNGRNWLLALDRSSTLSPFSFLPAWLTLAGGATISGLLFWLLLSITGTRQRAEALARQLSADILDKDRLLRESEYRWKFALEGSDLGVWDWNVRDSTVFFSRRWKEMLGYAEQEIGNGLDEWSDRVHPEDLESVMAAVKDYLEGRAPVYDNEHRVRCKDGSYKWIRDRGMVVERDGDGKALRMIGTHSDVTGNKLAELQLREAYAESQRLRDAMDGVSAYVYLKDAQSRYVYANKPTLELFRVSAAELAGADDDRFFPHEAAEHLRSIDRRVFAGENTHEEITIDVPGRGRRTFLEVKTPIYADAERKTLWGLCGISTDITELKTLNSTLQRQQAELQEAQRMARMGSWQLEVATGAVTWTEELYRIFGLDPQQPPPSFNRQAQIFGAESWERLNLALARTIGEGIPYELELECITVDGAMRWMLARGEAIRDAGGKVTAVRGTAADITDRKLAELHVRRLTRLYAALGDANAAVIHCGTEPELFQRICEIIVDLAGLDLAWIGLVDDSGRIRPAASHGSGRDYLDGIEVTVHADDPHGRGPTGTAARENRAVWVDDFGHAAMTVPWQQRAASHGWQSSAALPIRRLGKTAGALTFYSKKPGGWHDEQIRNLLERIAEAISLALDRFAATAEAEVSRRVLAESEQRFRTLVEQSIAGAFIIQDNRFIYANPRMAEILGYAGGDELVGMTPRDTVAVRDHAMTDARLLEFGNGDAHSLALAFTARRKDGSTVEVGVSIAKTSYRDRPALIGLMQDISDKKVAEEQIRRYSRQLEHAFMQMVALATTLSEMRDAYTAGHEKRVAEIAVAIGRELALPEDRIEGLRVGGYLHDVGKVSIPTEILSKPGRLSQVEMELVRTHAEAGYDVLKGIEFPWPVAQIALQHHERIDGSGYPKGLKGEEILLEARITAVADVVESMATHRPYRPALGLDKALAEIERGSGSLYDPQVAAACLRLFREKGYQLSDQH